MMPWLVTFLVLGAVLGTALFFARRRERAPEETLVVAAPGLGAGRASLILLGSLGVWFAVALIVSASVAVWELGGGSGSAATLRAVRSIAPGPAAVLAYIAVVPLILAWVKRALGLGSWREALRAVAGTATDVPTTLIAVAVGLTLSFLGTLLVRYAGPPPKDISHLFPILIGHPGWRRDLWAFAGVFLAPPVEELLYRGVLFEGFTRSIGQAWSAVVVTLLFVAGHIPNTHGWWPPLVGVACVAVASVCARILTRSLGPSVWMHAAYNLGVAVPLLMHGL